MRYVSPRLAYAVGGVGLLLIVLLGRLVAGGRGPDPDSTAFVLASAGAGPVPASALAVVEPIELRRGQTLEGALLDRGIPSARIAEAVDALRRSIDLRRMRPEDRILVYTSPEGALERLEIDRGPGEQVVLDAGSTGSYASWVEREPSVKRLKRLSGRVDDNLYLSMTRYGGNPGLVVEFADLFAWDFDFFTDTRQGDTFELLVEEEWIGGERVGCGRILAGQYLPVGQPSPLVAYYYSWADGKEGGYYDADGKSLRKFFLKSPLQYRRISSTFTTRRFHPIHKTYRPHLGVDYAAPTGTPVAALGNGKVVFVGWKGGYGRTVQIKHNATYLTQYAHLSRYGKGVKSGTRVKQGQTIGYVGMSGVATGPHLDFRVRQNGKWINPLTLKGGQSEPLPEGERTAYAEIRGHMEGLLRGMAPGQSVPLPSGETLSTLALARLDTLSSS